MTIGESIKRVRKKVGLTQAELADKLGISAAGIAQWENNIRNPKLETIKRIAAALEVSQFELLRPVMENDDDFVNSDWFAEMTDADILAAMIPPAPKAAFQNREENQAKQEIPESELRRRYIDNLLQCLNENGQKLLCEVAKGICMLDDYRINMPIAEFLNYEKVVKGDLNVKLESSPLKNER